MSLRARADRIRARGDELRGRSEELRQRDVVDVAVTLYARDRDAFASVLGSALALRLFLFVVPANVALIALVHIIRAGSLLDQTLESSFTTGELAANFGDISWWAAVWTFLSSFVLTLWAGRSLARVLATGSISAWQMPPREAKLRVKAILALSVLLFGLILAGDIFQRLRDAGGIALSMVSWVAVCAVITAGWFVVALSLPRSTRDPGSVLPGVALVGVGFTVLQWFMQFYLPRKIEGSSDRLGDLASTVAALSYFFFIGRLMSASFVVSAVVFERWGSVSTLVFGLPGLRRIRDRSPAVRRFFGLDEPAPIG